MVPSSDRKAAGVVVVADAGAAAAAPALLLLPFAFAIVPMDGLGQFHGTFFGRTDCRRRLLPLSTMTMHGIDDATVTSRPP